jgi:hypothetical protein
MKRRSARKNQNKKKLINRGNRKVIYRVTVIALLFLVSAFFLTGFFGYRYLNRSFASALTDKDLTHDIGAKQFPTLAYVVVENVNSDPIVITGLKFLIFDKVNKKVLIYSVPVDQKIDIAGKYGEEEISKIIALGGLNSPEPLENGTKVLENTLLKIFGFKVDKFLIVSREQSGLFDELLGNGSFLDLLRLKDVLKVREYFRTDLTLEEFYDLFSFIKSIPNDRLISKTLTAGDFIDPSAIDASYEDIGLNSYIATESKNISVLNGTDTSGIASLGARVVNNIGGRIVALGNADKTYSTSMIVTDDPNSQTCRFLSEVFGITNIVAKSANVVQEHEVDRSDIVVIIGFDTSEGLY